MDKNIVSNRHTAGSGIQGEWSIKKIGRKINKPKLLLSAITLASLFLAVRIGVAVGF